MSAVHTIDEAVRDRAEDAAVIDLTTAGERSGGPCRMGADCQWLALVAVRDETTGAVRWGCADHVVPLVRDQDGTTQVVDVVTPGIRMGPDTVAQVIADLHADAGVPSVVVPDGGPFRPGTGTADGPGPLGPAVRDGGPSGTGAGPGTDEDDVACPDCAGTGVHPDPDGSLTGLAGLPVHCGCMAEAAELADLRELVATWPNLSGLALADRLTLATQLAEALVPLVESLTAVNKEAGRIGGSAFSLGTCPDESFAHWVTTSGAGALGAALYRLSAAADGDLS